MKKIMVLLFLFLPVTLCAAPLYRAGAHKNAADDFSRWEVSADGVLSSAEVSDVRGQNALNGTGGLGLRGVYSVRPWLGLGAEGAYFPARSFGPFVDAYQTARIGTVAKLSLSPDTSPRVYFILGAGVSRHRFTFRKTPATAHWKTRRTDIPYVQAGLGLEVTVWKGWFAGLEGNMLYNTKTALTPYYRLGARWEKTLRLRAGVRF